MVRPTLLDRITPVAVGVVSRAWVLREVAAVPALDAAARSRLVDALSEYQPPRRQPMRDNAIAWVVLLGGAMLFNALDLPGWFGFVLALMALTAVARVLAVRALRWRMAQWLDEHAVLRGAQPGPPE
jgi:hypothetical protein